MTNTNTLTLLVMIAAMGCSTSSAPPPPEKVYDFAARPLTGTVAPTTSAARSPKAQIRRALDQLQPQLARCTSGTEGDLAITLRVELAVDQPAAFAGADVTYPDANAAACARNVVEALDLSVIDAREHAVWVVHAPFTVSK